MVFADLNNIEHPVARLFAGSVGGAAIAGIVTGAGIGLFAESEESAHKMALLATLAGAGGGAVAAMMAGVPATAKKADGAPVATPQPTEAPSAAWKGWRNFVVRRKVQESSEIASFYLQPEDGGDLPAYKPGQFLTIQLAIPDRERPTIRTYSLSDWSVGEGYYRLSIKRELAPKGKDVPPGLASNFMHDNVEVGTIIPAKPPAGKFFLDPAAGIPVVLISNGVGITPMMAMAKAIARANPQRHVWFLHGARTGETHAFREEVAATATDHANLRVHYRYSRPRPEDEGRYDAQGYVDKDLIANEILPAIEAASGDRAAEYYLCGSPAFMDSLLAGLKELEAPSDRVFFESFSKGGPKMAPAPAPAATAGAGKEVTFAKSGKTATWTPAAGTLLEFAEANGVDAPSSCRQGLCLTCMCGLVEGEVVYDEPPIGEPDAGMVLVCVSKPKSDRVVLDL